MTRPFRLAQGLTDSEPREWSAGEKYQLYIRGFKDGASARAVRDDHEGHPSYDRGYEEGRSAANAAISTYAKEIGYTPNILR